MNTSSLLTWTLALSLFCVASCAFDDSALDDRPPCTTDADCEDGRCIEGSCTPRALLESADATTATPDASTDDATMGGDADDASERDTLDADPPLLCTPGGADCEGSVAVVCDVLGRTLTETDCADSDACDGEFGCRCEAGACRARACRPGTSQCDGTSVVTCSEDGSGFAVTEACPDGALCLGGVCTAPSCMPGPSTCVGDAVVGCTTTGVFVVEADCSLEDAICRSDALGAYCEPLVCSAGDRRCSRDGSGVEWCEDGTAFVVEETCADDAYCENARCIALACAPGVTRCAGPQLRGVCSSDGREERLEPCSPLTYCDDTDGVAQCVRQACVPLEARCTADGRGVETCDTRGAGYLDPLPCASDAYCDNGECAPQICTPNQRFCDGDIARDCNTLGSASTVFATCPFGCVDGACLDSRCGDGIVDPDAGEQCDDGNTAICDGCEGCVARHVLAIGAGTATTSNASWAPGASVFTIELWANVTGDGALAGIGGALESDFASLDVSEGRVRFGFELGDGTLIRAVAPAALAPGWHHIAGVRFEAQGAALYVDGELVAAVREPTDNTGLDGSGRLWIGSEGSRPPATATLDEVRISSSVRYSAPFNPPRRLSADADTIALYAFDSDAPGAVRDGGGGGRDLALTATALAPDTCRDAPSASVCGDGELASWEACDDGNLDEGDGCDARCKVEVDCPGEVGPGGACYLFVTTAFSWRDARDNCRGWGGDLVVVDTATEAAWLSLIRGFTGTAWIGLNDRGSEGNYTWSSGASSGYRAWASGEPNNRFFSEDCVEQYGQDGGDNRARWNDSNCDDRRNAICER